METAHSVDEESLDDPADVLAAFRESQARMRAEEALQIRLAASYASMNEVDDWRRAASVDDDIPGGEGELLLGGDGAPWVAEFAVPEFAAVTGMSTNAARGFLGAAVALEHRLPVLGVLVQSGKVAGWRARRIALACVALPIQGAQWVDRKIAPIADKVGVTKLDHLVNEAIELFDPEQHLEDELDELSGRHVTIHSRHDIRGLAATTDVTATLDTLDALELDRVLSAGAQWLAAEGFSAESAPIRRAKALGMILRGELRIAARNDRGDGLPEFAAGESVELPVPDPVVIPTPRQVIVHVHLAEGGVGGTAHSLTGQPLGLISINQIREWCRTSNVAIKPVIDLNRPVASAGYQPSERVRDHVTELNRTCVFPGCDRPSEKLDLDHIEPYVAGGPPDQTTTENLAPLCRGHHRAKTFTGWHYQRLGPGVFLWTSPLGWRFLRATEGTVDLGRRAELRHAHPGAPVAA